MRSLARRVWAVNPCLLPPVTEIRRSENAFVRVFDCRHVAIDSAHSDIQVRRQSVRR